MGVVGVVGAAVVVVGVVGVVDGAGVISICKHVIDLKQHMGDMVHTNGWVCLGNDIAMTLLI